MTGRLCTFSITISALQIMLLKLKHKHAISEKRSATENSNPASECLTYALHKHVHNTVI